MYDIPIEYFFGDRGAYFPEVRRIASHLSAYECFYKMVHEYQISSLPVVDANDKYVGVVYIRDIAFVWRTQRFDIVKRLVYIYCYILFYLNINKIIIPSLTY
jgi:CBS-domain-containing membrane protein